MKFKGHIDFDISHSATKKLTVSAKTKAAPVVCDEYEYSEGRLVTHVDYINKKVVSNKYDERNKIEHRTWAFHDNPNVKELEGYKTFSYEAGWLTKENSYIILNGREELQCEVIKTHGVQGVIQEDFHYTDTVYSVSHHFNKEKNIRKTLDSESKLIQEYHFDQDGFLIRLIDFKQDDYCQITDYEYRNDQLYDYVEFPVQKYGRILFTGEVVTLEEPEFVFETALFYNSAGLLEKKTKTEAVNNRIIDELFYVYE